MPTFTRTFTVAAPRATVFAYLADFATTNQWDPNVSRAEKLTPGVPGPGSTFAVWAPAGGRDMRLEYRIESMSAPERLVLKGEGSSIILTDSFEFAEQGPQCTAVSYQMQAQGTGISGKLMERFPSLLEAMLDKAVAGLQYAFSAELEPIRPASVLADKLVLPGVSRFPRRGFRVAKQSWKGMALDLAGKRVVITGATAGIGRAAALELAKMGAQLMVVARSQHKVEALAQWLLAETGQQIDWVLADLSLISQTRAAAQQILARWPVIDVLINNAGALFNERQETQEGFEQSFATLLLSPFVLTETLLPGLQAGSEPARVINVTSGGMYTQALHLDDLNFERGRYDGPAAYARAKRGLVDITEVWARRYAAKQLSFHCMHPGWADTQGVQDSLPGFYRATRHWLRNAYEGADTLVWLAASPAVHGRSGELWLDRQPHTTAVFPGTQTAEPLQDQLYDRLQALQLRFVPQAVEAEGKEQYV